MNYFEGIFVTAMVALIVTLLGQIPYQFNNKVKLRELGEQKKQVKLKLKRISRIERAGHKPTETYESVQMRLMKVNWEISRRIMIPLIIQMAMIFYALNKLRILNPMFLWLLWYVGFAMLFSKMWKHVVNKVFHL